MYEPTSNSTSVQNRCIDWLIDYSFIPNNDVQFFCAYRFQKTKNDINSTEQSISER